MWREIPRAKGPKSYQPGATPHVEIPRAKGPKSYQPGATPQVTDQVMFEGLKARSITAVLPL